MSKIPKAGRGHKSALADLLPRVRALRWKTRYTRQIEAELAAAHAECTRVRQENRALLNSILGIAGIPPVYTNSAEKPRTFPSPQPGPEAPALTTPADEADPLRTPVTGPVSPSSSANGSDATSARSNRLAQVAAPVRRRSWHQINRLLEFEAARKKPQPDATDV